MESLWSANQIFYYEPFSMYFWIFDYCPPSLPLNNWLGSLTDEKLIQMGRNCWVQILAVTSYPAQHYIIFKKSNKIHNSSLLIMHLKISNGMELMK